MKQVGKPTPTPKLGFPEFRNWREWEVSALGEVCDMRAGKFVSASDIAESPGDSLFPCYGGNGLRGYTKPFTHEGKYSLIGRQGALCGNGRLFHATEHALVVTPNDGVNTEWLCYALTTFSVQNDRLSTMPAAWCPFEFLFPVIEEQQRIAACLSALDARLAAESAKLAALQTHKKGLMQQLLPSPEKN